MIQTWEVGDWTTQRPTFARESGDKSAVTLGISSILTRAPADLFPNGDDFRGRIKRREPALPVSGHPGHPEPLGGVGTGPIASNQLRMRSSSLDVEG